MNHALRYFAHVLLLVLILAAIARAAPTLNVDTRSLSIASVKEFAIKIKTKDPTDIAFKVYDADGKFVRLLAERRVDEGEITVPWNLRGADGQQVAAGSYTAVLASGLRVKLDKSFGKDGVLEDEAFKSPSVLRLDNDGNLYLLDLGNDTLFKFSSEGTPVNEWKGKNTIKAASSPCWAGLAVEPDGSSIYLSEGRTTSHVIGAFDGRTGARLRDIGAFFQEDLEWQKEKGGIVYPLWVGLNGDSKIYSCSPGYDKIWALDRHKAGKAAGIWALGTKANPRVTWHSAGDCGDTDGKNAIYLASSYLHNRAQLYKILDSGDSGKFVYDITQYSDKAKKNVELRDIHGVAYDGSGGVWVVERSPPRLLKIADNGAGFNFVASFGAKGKNPARPEFLAPCGVGASPDGKLLYVVEDGEPIGKDVATTGPARVLRYKIDYADRKSLKLTVRP